MHAHGVDIFNAADDDAVVRFVAHHFHLIFFPAQHALIDHHFADGRCVESAKHNALEFFGVIGNAAAAATHGEAWANDGGKAHDVARFAGFVERFYHAVFGHFQTDARHGVTKQLAIFRLVDGFQIRADEFYIVLLQHAAFGEGLRAVQRGLATHGWQQRIGLFGGDNFFHIFRRDRFDVGGIRQIRVSHDGGRVGIHQNDAVAFGLQRLHRLRAGIIKLARLPYDDGPRADDEDGFNVSTFRH